MAQSPIYGARENKVIYVKTEAGQQMLKDRHGGLTSRQRSAFILFDGKRRLHEVLTATASMGITQQDIDAMVQQGLLASVGSGDGMPPQAAPVAAPASAEVVETAAAPVESGDRSPIQRYQDAYPIATELTAKLGLRGFKLNLAVEAAGSYYDLAALAPRIHEAVGNDEYVRLERALFR